jgi:hypothetical protein
LQEFAQRSNSDVMHPCHNSRFIPRTPPAVGPALFPLLQANGEGNNDGSNDNFSWNCGIEGPTGDAGITALRARMMRNYQVALMMAVGTPMMVMGAWGILVVCCCFSHFVYYYLYLNLCCCTLYNCNRATWARGW